MNVNPLSNYLFIYLFIIYYYYFFLTFNNRSDFHKSNLIFYPFQKQVWFLQIKSHFLTLQTTNMIFYSFKKKKKKTDLIFTNQISFFFNLAKTDLIFLDQIFFILLYFFFTLYKNRFDFYKSSFIFFFNFQNWSDFSLKRGHIHKTNLFKLSLLSVCHVYYNISFNIIQKGYIIVIRV